jgi:hypothetical protein
MSGIRWADTTDDEEYLDDDQPEIPMEEQITPQQVRSLGLISPVHWCFNIDIF